MVLQFTIARNKNIGLFYANYTDEMVFYPIIIVWDKNMDMFCIKYTAESELY